MNYFKEKEKLRTLFEHNPYPTTQLPNPRANPNKNELKVIVYLFSCLYYDSGGENNKTGSPHRIQPTWRPE